MYYYIEDVEIGNIKYVMKQLYLEMKMDGDKMRDMAQLLQHSMDSIIEMENEDE